MRVQLRRRLLFIVKLGTTLAFLGYVSRHVDLSALRGLAGSIRPVRLSAALLLTFAAVAIGAWRWHRVLVYLGESVPLRSLMASTLVAGTYNLLLPTSVGGDVARALRCSKAARDPHHAFVSTLFERLVGFAALALSSAVGLIVSAQAGTRRLLVVSVAISLALTALLSFAPWPLRWGESLLSSFSFSARLASVLGRFAELFAGPLGRARVRWETLGWSLAYQFVNLGILVAAGGEDALLAIFLGVPIALLGAALPISIGGLGVRESLFVLVLAPFGVTAERAFALALVWLTSNLVVGLAGSCVLLVEKR